jgi:hypothetical protein
MRKTSVLFVFLALGCSTQPGAIPIPSSDSGPAPDAPPVGLCSAALGGAEACFSYLTAVECGARGGEPVTGCVGPYAYSCTLPDGVLVLVDIPDPSEEASPRSECEREGGTWRHPS